MLGSSKSARVLVDGHFDKKGQNAPSWKSKKGSAKMVRRPLFQDQRTANVDTLPVTEAVTSEVDFGQVGDASADAVEAAVGARSDGNSGAEPKLDDSGLVSCEEEDEQAAALGADIEDYEKEDTLLYTEEDLLDDLAFRAAVAYT